MLYGFEQETAPLNEIELRAAHDIAYGMNTWHVGAEKAVTAQHICNSLAQGDARYRDAKGKPYLTGARMRKIINYIRVSGMCRNLIASSKGYYVSNDRNELQEYINSLRARAEAIVQVAKVMEAAL